MGDNSILEKYEDNLIARMIVSAIPYIGGSVDIALTSKWEGIRQKRIEDQLQKITESLSDLTDKLPDQIQQVVESEPFYDLIYQIADNAIKSRCSETRIGYARVIREAVEHSDRIPDLEEIVYQISDMRQTDFILLKAIKELFDTDSTVSGETVSARIPLGYSPKICERRLLRFEYLGLLDHSRNMITRVGGLSFEKTDLFDRLIKFLN